MRNVKSGEACMGWGGRKCFFLCNFVFEYPDGRNDQSISLFITEEGLEKKLAFEHVPGYDWLMGLSSSRPCKGNQYIEDIMDIFDVDELVGMVAQYSSPGYRHVFPIFELIDVTYDS